MTASRTPELSVVVPAYRAEATIADCLDALAAQRDPPRFEVLVVDSSPDERTRTAAGARRSAGREIDLTILSLAERSFAGPARNLGARRARADRLLFLDADCLAAPDLLRQALRALVEVPGVVGGAIAHAGVPTVSSHVRHLLEFKESLPGVPARRTWQLPSACVAFDRGVFERHGGYPDTRAAEDWRLNWRMWQAGESLRFDPRLRVAHLTPSGWGALRRYCGILGRASGRARREADLPGQLVVRWPVLALGLPLARTARALLWCARYAPREAAFLLLAWPGYLAMATIWASAFYRGLRDEPAVAGPASLKSAEANADPRRVRAPRSRGEA